MERIPLHSWEMGLSIQYHMTIINQLNDQNSMRYYIILFIHELLSLVIILSCQIFMLSIKVRCISF